MGRGEDGAKVGEAREGVGGEGKGVDGVEAAETDFDDVVLGFEEAGEEGFAAHRGGEDAEGKGAALEDPCEVGGVVVGGEFEAEVGQVGEALEGAVEEAEKVGGQDVFGPFEIESTDERGIDVVARERLHEPQCALRGNVDECAVQHTSGDVMQERAGSEYRNEIAPRKVPQDELERLWW